MYYVITKNSELVAVTTVAPYDWNLADVSISKFDGVPYPDLNTMVWDDTVDNFVKSSNVYTKLAFLNRFTSQERVAIRASVDPIVIDFMELMNAASEIDRTNPDTVAGINYLVTVGLLTAQRAQEVLA